MSNSPRDTHPLKSNQLKAQIPPEKTELPSEPVRSPWTVKLFAPEQSIPIQLEIDDRAVIGRSDPDGKFKPDIDLLANNQDAKGISRRHAEIRAGRDFLVIIDMNSTNGTRLNGFTLQPHEPYRLHNGDSLEIGTLKLQVQISMMPVHEGVKVIKRGTGQLRRTPDEDRYGTRRHVLVVEHDENTARVIVAMLQSLGYRASSVDSTGEAMRFIAAELPDGVLVDLAMPDHPGTEVCRMIKKDLGNVHVPIFVVSAQTEEDIIKEAFDAGADVFLGKPVGADELLQGLVRFVGNPIITPED
ncbi:MAG: response regulator [Anaerolineales bacterium]|nr:response regulator [Anaerolineales bacterium]